MIRRLVETKARADAIATERSADRRERREAETDESEESELSQFSVSFDPHRCGV